MNGDNLPDDLHRWKWAVTFTGGMVCTHCGYIGADVRPDWSPHVNKRHILISGRSLERSINFALTRIVPPPGVQIDPRQRPVVVVDPLAGQGPGIGGLKEQSRSLHCRFWCLASSSFFALRGLSRRRRAHRDIASIR
jgi:hypothetical protein